MESDSLSKSAKKNQKRKEKNAAAVTNKDDKVHIQTPSEVLGRLKKEFEVAKASNDLPAQKKLRQQIWVLSDMIAGVKTDIAPKELAAILETLQLQDPLARAAAAESSSLTSAVSDNFDKSEPERRLRNLQKRLKQITELKAKQKKGEQLEKNQIEKIESESKVLEEIDELETILRSCR